MSLVSREGTFRGFATDWGVSTTSKSGYPQLQAVLSALEWYNPETQEWENWNEYGEEITAYLVLFGSEGKALMNAKQIQKVFGWSGQSFKELDDFDYSEVQFQFRVEDEEYEGNTTRKVTWIDEYDASPGRTVQKLDAAKLKQLDAAYSKALKGFGGTKVAGKVTRAEKPTAPKVIAAPESTTASENTGEVETDVTPPEIATPAVPKKAGKTTKTKAWRAVVARKEENEPDMTDEELSEIWTKAVMEVAPAKKGKNLTDEEWFRVQESAEIQILPY